MGKRLISLLTALALAVSAFASLAVAPAGAVVEDLGNEIYFPFLPNGEEYGNMGPWYSTFTVQNPNNFSINVSVRKADGTVVTTAQLQPFASKTWPASAVFGDGNGGGVYVVGPAQQDLGPNQRQYTVVRGSEWVSGPDVGGTTDRIPNPCGTGGVSTITVRQGDNVFVLDPTNTGNGAVDAAAADYDYQPVGTRIDIVWDTAGSRPAPGTTYTVTVTCRQNITAETRIGPIAGVAKIVAPVEAPTARTSAQQESVSGYTALPREDVRIGGLRRLVFPIVQTNNGWDSVLHITNFDTQNNCGVTVTLYQSPSGYSDPSFGQFTRLLNRGQTWHIDLAEQGVPAGWVGQAWVSSDCDVAATVDRVKAAQPWGTPVNMALTNQALPTQAGNTTQALPLVFQSYNGWNTGYSIANLSNDTAAAVTINYYNQAGNLVGTENRVIQPRAMEFVYRPATTDINIGGFGSALVTSNQPVLVAVDSVKYTGSDQDVGQALSYVAQRGVGTEGGSLYMPLFQKQGQLSGGNDNSGVALFNLASGERAVALWLFDSSGALVAPTLATPVTALLPAHGQFIFYAPTYGEMPGGLQGSVLVVADGDVVGVSNNVNYDVQFDGSAAYNMPVSDTTPMTLACEINGDGDWEMTVDLGIPQSLPVVVDVNGTPHEGVTDENGQATIVDGTAAASSADATLYLDVNNNGEVDNVDVLLATATCPAPASDLPPALT
ncbi:MAG: hypothetical protein RMJ05_03605 [Thermomicrobium sp.]|nr:DUF4815 domain-containing protein [Thermomicrobium sp.]MDW8005784.1 hypothetical protein [Thermomicrobium sp.]